MYSRCFDPIKYNHLWINKLSNRLTYFCLSIGFLKDYPHNKCERDLWTNFNDWGWVERDTYWVINLNLWFKVSEYQHYVHLSALTFLGIYVRVCMCNVYVYIYSKNVTVILTINFNNCARQKGPGTASLKDPCQLWLMWLIMYMYTSFVLLCMYDSPFQSNVCAYLQPESQAKCAN